MDKIVIFETITRDLTRFGEDWLLRATHTLVNVKLMYQRLLTTTG